MSQEGELNDLEEGATGGEEPETSRKFVPDGFYLGETGVSVEDGRPPLSGYHQSMSSNQFKSDIDLRNEKENKDLERVCCKTYKAEKACELGKQVMDQLEMNIPVSDMYRKEKKELSMAEHQNSFQTITSEGGGSMNANNSQVNGAVVTPDTPGSALVTSLTGATHVGKPTDDHGGNLQVNSLNWTPNNMVNRQRSRTSDASDNNSGRAMMQNNLSSSQNSNMSTVSGVSNITNTSNYSIRGRCRISDNTLLSDCPSGLIGMLSLNFNGKGGKNWRDLLDIYGWKYKDIKLFANKSHPEGYFCSILEEEDFQECTVMQMKENLSKIPKLDTLSDLEKFIAQYNNSLCG